MEERNLHIEIGKLGYTTRAHPDYTGVMVYSERENRQFYIPHNILATLTKGQLIDHIKDLIHGKKTNN